MTPDRWSRIAELFEAARAQPSTARAAYLDAACGADAELRREVESLLANDGATGSFLAQPAAAALGIGHEPSAPGRLVGQVMGPYEVIALLGVGGMGEVYRARDRQLGRDVAIKVLPHGITHDPIRRARFEREARMLAAFTHPNIATIHGIETIDGHQALVMELVDGETLETQIARGPLALGRALAIARQIAEALDAAHEKGIIHRDLKPANVKVLPDGRVKVLDFGLAKASSREGTDAGAAPTMTAQATEAGLVMGTPAYMSPEQARGQAVDKRTDIWAFGCVLYEMLTGRRAFAGRTITDTMVAVLEREPDWTKLPSEAPEALRRVLIRCCEKDIRNRARDIGDVRAEIEDLLNPARRASVVEPNRKPLTRRRTIWIAGAAAALLAASAAAWSFYESGPAGTPAGAPEANAAAVQLTRLTFDAGLQTTPALSPDGRVVAYAANKAGAFDIFLQPISGGNAVQVTTHPAHDWQPDWSGKDQLVFRSERDGGGLYVVAPTGGHEMRVSTFGAWPVWSPDGTTILFRAPVSGVVYTVGLDGAAPVECRPCGQAGAGGAIGWAYASRQFARLRTTPAPNFEPALDVIDPASGAGQTWTARPGVEAAFKSLRVSVPGSATVSPLRWTTGGRSIYFLGEVSGLRSVWRLDIDPSTREITGGPHRLATMTEDSTGLAVSPGTDAVVLSAGSYEPRVWSFPLAPDGLRVLGAPSPLTPEEVASAYPTVTPDGRILVYQRSQSASDRGRELRLRTMADGSERVVRITDPVQGESRSTAFLSPDGRILVFRYSPPNGGGANGTQQLRAIDLDRDTESPVTGLADGVILPNGWSRDGRFVLATRTRRRATPGATGMMLGLIPFDARPDAEPRMRVLAIDTRRSLWQPSLSPDGRWLAFVVGGVNRVVVARVPDDPRAAPLEETSWRGVDDDPAPQDKPRWSSDGRVLYYTSLRGGLWNVWGVEFDPQMGGLGKRHRLTTFEGPGERMPEGAGEVDFDVAKGTLFVPAGRPTGAIWLLQATR